MKTLNSAALALIVATMTAPALAVSGLSGSGNASGGVNSDSIQKERSSDPLQEEQNELQQRKQDAENSIEDSDQAANDRDRQMRGEGSFSAGSEGFSGSADTEEAEE